MTNKNLITFCIAIILGFVVAFLCSNMLFKSKKEPELAIFLQDFLAKKMSEYKIYKKTFEGKWTLKSDTAIIVCTQQNGDELFDIVVNENSYTFSKKKNTIIIPEPEFIKSSLSYPEKIRDYVRYGKLVCNSLDWNTYVN